MKRNIKIVVDWTASMGSTCRSKSESLAQFKQKMTTMMSERTELFIDYLEMRQRYIISIPNKESLGQSDILIRGMVLWSYTIPH